MLAFISTNKNIFLITFKKYAISSPLRIAHFLAQAIHETGGFLKFSENLNYTPDGLIATFGIGRISRLQANQFGRLPNRTANLQAIANILYGGSYGRLNLGNTQFGDGWKFRGRGIFQLTGRAAYKAYSDFSGLDLITNPDLAANIAISIDIAGWFWAVFKKINQSADINSLETVTKKINGSTKSTPKRLIDLIEVKKQNLTLASFEQPQLVNYTPVNFAYNQNKYTKN